MYLGTCLSLGGMKQKQRKGSEVLLYNPPPPILHSQASSKKNYTSVELKNIWFEMGILKWWETLFMALVCEGVFCAIFVTLAYKIRPY